MQRRLLCLEDAYPGNSGALVVLTPSYKNVLAASSFSAEDLALDTKCHMFARQSHGLERASLINASGSAEK